MLEASIGSSHSVSKPTSYFPTLCLMGRMVSLSPSLAHILPRPPLLHSLTACFLLFFHQEGLSRYPIVFDINLEYVDAMNRLQFLVDGHYIDNATKEIDVQFVTYNGKWENGVTHRA